MGFHKDCVFVKNLAGDLAAEGVVALREDLLQVSLQQCGDVCHRRAPFNQGRSDLHLPTIDEEFDAVDE
ncbi:hypothetical protein D3C87_2079050 [compost metagenome]